MAWSTGMLGRIPLPATEARVVAGGRDDVQQLCQLLVGTPPGPGVDWETVAALARLHEVSSLLCWRLQHQCAELFENGTAAGWADVPPKVQETLRDDYYSDLAQRVVVDSELTRILTVLEAARVPMVLLKGAALAYSVYPDPALRTMVDLDLLVPIECCAVMDEQLTRLGYRRQKRDRPGYRPLRFVQRFAKDWSYHGPLHLEMHHRLVGGEWIRSASRMDGIAADVMSRAVPVRDGTLSRQLSPEDALLHLCVHLAVNNAFTGRVLRNLLDVALLVEQEHVQWSMVIDRARRWRIATACYTALYTAVRLFDASIPNEVLRALQPGAVRKMLLQHILDGPALVQNPWRFVGLWRFLLQLLLIDQLSDALRLLGHAFFPNRQWLMLRYDLEHTPRWRLWLLRLWHPVRVVLHGEV